MNILDYEGASNILADILVDLADTKTGTIYLDHMIQYIHNHPEEASIITTALAIAKQSIDISNDDDIAVRPTEVFGHDE